MKPIARVSPTSGSIKDYAQYNMNSSGGSNSYNNPGSNYSKVPFYMLSQGSSTSSGNNSSNYDYNRQYSYSANSTYLADNTNSVNSYPSSSYENEAQSQSSYQYNPIISSDTSSNYPFTYTDGSSSGRRKNRGYQPWVKRDSLKRPAPYSGDRGITLMQKMGWNPGQGLGRRENGELEPQFPDIKMNKRGLDVAQKELKVPVSVKAEGGRKIQMATIKLVTEGKNPVSILEEYCSKRKLGAPKYEAVVDEGPVHAKNFMFKVSVDGVDYTADKGSNVKKTARLEAAKKCLVELGILSKE